ncbi:MAG TPA: acyl-CoA dehydrogenase family protein [Stellaceae bacterium]|jgi:alkylation response protein AidB-like acyl-CoA dehydrogenase|nr:acyl-CoA dehydrogenase family protein [Stellaceae bacterium]
MLKLKDTDRHITDSIAELLEATGGLARVRRLQSGTQGFDRDAWAKLAESGWLGAAVPEAAGGTGLATREIALLLEYAGKKLLPEPLVPALAASLILAKCGAAGAGLLAELIAGKTIVMPIEAEEGLKAPTAYASDAHAADMFLALIDDQLVGIPRATKGVNVETEDTVDGGSIARLAFDGISLSDLTVLAGGQQAREAFAAGRDLALIGYGALLVGLADEALAMTVQYLKDRKQFGVPIGTFQALQHRAASLYVIIKGSHALLYEACEAGTARRAIAALSAKSYAAETALTTVKECVALHGAMGYTAEHSMSLYFRRAMALAVAGGDAVTCRKRLHAERQLLQDF